MADPLSIAASVVTLLQLTEIVLTSCYRFVGHANNAATEVDRTIREAGSLKVILLDLKNLVDEYGDSRLSSVNSLGGENGALTACIKSLQELESKLSPAVGPMSIRRRLLWPFESKKVDEILDNIQKQKPTLLLALVSDNTRATLATQESLEMSKLRVEREEILNWLRCVDPTVKHLASRGLHQPGSNHWVLESEIFKEWKQTPGRTLWLHGIPGAGKTIICSTIIDHMDKICKVQPGTRMAYYYFDFNDASVQQLGTLLRSLILQLSRPNELLSDHVRSLYEHCDNGRNEPDEELLASTFFEVLNGDQQAFVIIDALDECPAPEREQFYELIIRRIGEKPGRYNFLVTSRKESDIGEAMAEITQLYNLPIQSGGVDADVRLHVHQFILGNRRLKKWSEELRTEIEETIVRGAQGMFRWAVCQLDLIKNCMQPTSVRKKLKDLPKTLEETYDRILATIPEETWQIARAALLLLAYSLRPLTLRELAEAMVVDIKDQCFDPKEHRLNDHRDALEICSSLVTVFKVKNDRSSSWLVEKDEIERKHFASTQEIETVQFAHFSVKEYVVLQRSKAVSPFNFSDTIAHRHIAEISLIYLLDFSDGARIDRFDFEAFPFLAYAARYWHEHWRLQLCLDDQASVNALMRRLFESSKPNSYINFLNICNPEKLVNRWFGRLSLGSSGGKSLDAFPQPLYYTAQLGHNELSEWLLEDERCDVNSKKGTFGQTLQIAAFSGHEKTVKFLLDHGADINALGGEYGCALQAAAFAGHEQAVRMLLDHGADVNTLGGRFASALIAACHGGHLATAKVLLDRGADINVISTHQGKALNVGASTGNTQLVRLLLQSGADINDTNGGEGSALYAAAEKGALDTVRMLVSAGADVNLKSGYKCTALQAACSKNRIEGTNGNIEVAKFLLKSGADCNIRGGEYGDTLQACIEAGNVESNVGLLQILLDHGADVDYQGGKYNSAIEAAVCTGNIEAAHILLDRGVPVDDEIFLLSLRYERTSVIPLLLEKGVNVNAQNTRGTALQMAIKENYVDTTMALLEDPLIDINAKGGGNGETALYYAVSKRNKTLVSLLLDRGADVNSDGGYEHCLCVAVMRQDEAMVRLLLERGANVNARGKGYAGTPLIAAVERENDDLINLLLSHGANVNGRGDGYVDALQSAAIKGNERIVKLLLDQGADVKAPEGIRGSCLECAILSKNIDLANFLLDRGANVNSTSRNDRSGPGGALFAAIISGHNTLIPLLIDRGADVNAISRTSSDTAIQTAIRWENEESIRILLNNGADVNRVGGRGGSALVDAIERPGDDYARIVQLLLDAGADINLQGGSYGCPLAAAVRKSRFSLVEKLLDLGADINAPAGDYGTVLQAAVSAGDLDIFRLLLSRGADVNSLGGYNNSALGAAAGRQHDTMLKELLEHGADPSLGESHALAAAAYDGNDNAVSILLDAGADLHFQEGVPGKALKEAASRGLVPTCKILLDRGADVNAVGGCHGNALTAILGEIQTARTNLVAPMVTLLLERGAKVNLPPSEKFTSALQAAIHMGNTQYIDPLLDSGADINAHDPRFGTALTAAAELRNTAHLKKLLARGADPHLGGGTYGTALQAASYCHGVESIEILLNHGVNVNHLSGKYGYALHAACCKDQASSTIKLLLKRGATANIRGGKYETALQCAAKHGHLETVKLLLDNGADPTVEGGKYKNPMEAALAKNHYHVANFLRRWMERKPDKRGPGDPIQFS